LKTAWFDGVINIDEEDIFVASRFYAGKSLPKKALAGKFKNLDFRITVKDFYRPIDAAAVDNYNFVESQPVQAVEAFSQGIRLIENAQNRRTLQSCPHSTKLPHQTH
jgi:hypothetical protein